MAACLPSRKSTSLGGVLVVCPFTMWGQHLTNLTGYSSSSTQQSSRTNVPSEAGDTSYIRASCLHLVFGVPFDVPFGVQNFDVQMLITLPPSPKVKTPITIISLI